MRTKISQGWKNAPIRIKFTVLFLFPLLLILLFNLFLYLNINYLINRVDDIFISNVTLNELSDKLDEVQGSMTMYLETKSSDALEGYYSADQEYRLMLEELNTDIIGNSSAIAQKNIVGQSETYLDNVYEAIQAKRGRNVQRYSSFYEESSLIYTDIKNCIFSLNNAQFKDNSMNYLSLLKSIRYMEIMTIVFLAVVTILDVMVLLVLTKTMTKPLVDLSIAANEVATGNFSISIDEYDAEDEVGIVSKAFQKMVASIQIYIQEIRDSLKRENLMKEKELMMETRMRETELKTLQAQINPHFLFNTLNAGAQLAMLEGADKTTEYIDHTASFFRYNLKKMSQDTTIEEEIKMVDNYIYILNVRFTGEIHYEKNVDFQVCKVKVPSMILQPIVENAVNYGIRNIDWEGHIFLKACRQGDFVYLTVEDNGVGIDKETLESIQSGEMKPSSDNSDSNGIGLENVKERLQIYTGREDVFYIESDGRDKGTRVILKVPAND